MSNPHYDLDPYLARRDDEYQPDDAPDFDPNPDTLAHEFSPGTDERVCWICGGLREHSIHD